MSYGHNPAIPMNAPISGFAPYPYPSPFSCYDPCPSGNVRQVPQFTPFPFSPFWKRTQTGNAVTGRIATTAALDDILGACLPGQSGGFCKQWWYLKAFGKDVVVDDEADLPNVVPWTNLHSGHSMLKLEVLGRDGPVHHKFICDLGSRLDASIGPFDYVEAWVLVPDYAAYLSAGGLAPDSPFNAQAYFAKSVVVPSVVGAVPAGHQTLRYTQSLYFKTGQTSWEIDVPPAAKSVQVFVNDQSDPTPVVSYILSASLPVVLGTINVGDTEEDHEIPDNASRIRVAWSTSSGPDVVTLVFRLDV
jgi:hypothetical protein